MVADAALSIGRRFPGASREWLRAVVCSIGHACPGVKMVIVNLIG